MATPDRARFGLAGYPLPKNAHGKTFFDKGSGMVRLRRAFRQLVEERGVGLLTAEAGVGKTTAIRNLCAELPRPDYLVIYLCNTTVSAIELYRALAAELGLPPSHRRGQLWTDIKKTLVHMVDDKGVCPLLVIDEAHFLSDAFLFDLAGFLNFAFDSRELLTLWLVGQPPLVKRLSMQSHAALRTRVALDVRLEPLDRETFAAAVDHGLKAQGATHKIVADPAMEMLFRSSRGVLREAHKILRAAFRLAGEREQAFVDEATMQAAVDELTSDVRSSSVHA